MRVLILKNISAEGPGTIGDYLRAKEITHTIVDLSKGERISDAEAFDILIMMGGPMSVNEADIYAYIKEEEALVRKFVAAGKKVFGVCLGAQIMAKALGASVYKGKEAEIGWYDIELAGYAAGDPLIMELSKDPQTGDISKRFKVFHWHGETFDIPEGTVRLAGSALFPNQAFRYGNSAYAFQFHIEVRKEMISEWLKNENMDLDRIERETAMYYDVYTARANKFYELFFRQ